MAFKTLLVSYCELRRQMRFSRRSTASCQLPGQLQARRASATVLLVRVHLGEAWIAQEPFQVGYLTHWEAPYTGGGECELPRGTIVKVISEPPSHATAAGCRPINYDEVELIVIPEEVRQTPKYAGYMFSIPFERFGTTLAREPESLP
jgi:hypothetical protein